MQVFRRNKESRRSRHKSLKGIMSGIERLSRRFSKKTMSKADGESHLQLSLPSTQSAPLGSKPPVKPKPNVKPKYLKRGSHKNANATVVADIVKRYSDPKPDATGLNVCAAADNPSYVDGESISDSRGKYISCIALTDDGEVNQSGGESDERTDIPVKFSDTNVFDGTSGNAERAQTPMTNHTPDIGSGLTYAYRASIHIEQDETM